MLYCMPLRWNYLLFFLASFAIYPCILHSLWRFHFFSQPFRSLPCSLLVFFSFHFLYLCILPCFFPSFLFFASVLHLPLFSISYVHCVHRCLCCRLFKVCMRKYLMKIGYVTKRRQGHAANAMCARVCIWNFLSFFHAKIIFVLVKHTTESNQVVLRVRDKHMLMQRSRAATATAAPGYNHSL